MVILKRRWTGPVVLVLRVAVGIYRYSFVTAAAAADTTVVWRSGLEFWFGLGKVVRVASWHVAAGGC